MSYILVGKGLAENMLGESVPTTLSMRPKAELVFDKFEFRFALIPAVHKPAPLGTIRLVGHTDFIGDEKYNKSLGMNRAKAVRVALAGELNIKMRGVTPRL